MLCDEFYSSDYIDCAELSTDLKSFIDLFHSFFFSVFTKRVSFYAAMNLAFIGGSFEKPGNSYWKFRQCQIENKDELADQINGCRWALINRILRSILKRTSTEDGLHCFKHLVPVALIKVHFDRTIALSNNFVIFKLNSNKEHSRGRSRKGKSELMFIICSLITSSKQMHTRSCWWKTFFFSNEHHFAFQHGNDRKEQKIARHFIKHIVIKQTSAWS